MMFVKVAAVFNLIVILFWLYQWGSFAVALADSPSDEPGCVEMGTVDDETIYYCESDYGVRCVWDPSPVLGAGVMDCEW